MRSSRSRPWSGGSTAPRGPRPSRCPSTSRRRSRWRATVRCGLARCSGPRPINRRAAPSWRWSPSSATWAFKWTRPAGCGSGRTPPPPTCTTRSAVASIAPCRSTTGGGRSGASASDRTACLSRCATVSSWTSPRGRRGGRRRGSGRGQAARGSRARRASGRSGGPAWRFRRDASTGCGPRMCSRTARCSSGSTAPPRRSARRRGRSGSGTWLTSVRPWPPTSTATATTTCSWWTRTGACACFARTKHRSSTTATGFRPTSGPVASSSRAILTGTAGMSSVFGSMALTRTRRSACSAPTGGGSKTRRPTSAPSPCGWTRRSGGSAAWTSIATERQSS
jgi:hypothetical protein